MCRAKSQGGRRCPSHSPSARRAGRAAADTLPIVDLSYRSFKTAWTENLSNIKFLPEKVPSPETERALLSIKKDPKSMVRIYRAMPAHKNQINSGGDFVGLSWEVAEQYRKGMTAAQRERFHVVSAIVPASDILTRRDPEGNVQLHEFGYDGPSFTAEPYMDGAPGTPYKGEKVSVGDWVSVDSGGDGGGIFWARVTDITDNHLTLPVGPFEHQYPMDRVTHHEPSNLPIVACNP